MRNCLQLCSGDYDFVGEFEKNRVALISAQGIRKKNIDDRESLLTARALMRSERRVEGVSDNWWVPSIAVTAEAVICQTCSRLTLKQTFVNAEKEALDEAVYTFPLYEGAAVVAFTCTVQDQVIVGDSSNTRQQSKGGPALSDPQVLHATDQT
ncbi:hypothetical protein AXG93_4225s1440 [Marchantia polymorpha subsp. ruderalis]|uniref:VIT domain-containing protein n=1 Tax=Marchantia polymorpha subsp. ruderalis TaxID=1480154 RepID=A0A176WRV0_MARPO|nr:hypothetical protein AXG93_4225s1440 [Marchantia polymorpha subsp. ruderalis]